MKNKSLLLFASLSFTLLMSACIADSDYGLSNIDLSGPCQSTTTTVNIKAIDAYSNEPLSNQQFDIIEDFAFSFNHTLTTLHTSDLGKATFTFTHNKDNIFTSYFVAQNPQKPHYYAINGTKKVLLGCVNDFDLFMKKPKSLTLIIENKSNKTIPQSKLTAFSCQASLADMLLDSIPASASKEITIPKIPEELIDLFLNSNIQSQTFSFKDQFRPDSINFEKRKMVIK